MKTIVVSAVNLRKGGTLKILRQTLDHLSRVLAGGIPLSGRFGGVGAGELRVVALVHDRSLCDYPGIEYIEMPECVRSWGRRLWAEYVTMNRISRELAERDGGPVWLWLSLHDTSPRVKALHREVYCHTSFPFMKIKARDWLMDPKIPLFCLFTKWAYRINVRGNDCLIVQQEWFADALSRLTGVERGRFRVIPPVAAVPPAVDEGAHAVSAALRSAGVPIFFYAATPDCHKNFETLCEASAMLERKGLEFRTVITINGEENRYSRWLKKRWGDVGSIDFHGFMGRDELYGHYLAAACFVCPSRVETWCLPISEFMEVQPHGRMLLADLLYARETSHGEATFFRYDSPVRLAAEMEKVISSYENPSDR